MIPLVMWLRKLGAWLNAVAKFQEVAINWNYNIFGNIFFRRKMLINRMHGIEKKLQDNFNP